MILRAQLEGNNNRDSSSVAMSINTILFITGCFMIYQVIGSHGLTLRTYTPASFKAPSPNVITSNVLPLTRAAGKGSQNGAVLYALRNNRPIPRYGTANLTSVEGNEFIASARFGNQELELVVDTGSADTWVAAAGFTCMDIYDFLEFPESWYGFGTLYESNSSTTFVPIPDENIWVRYGDGRWGVGNFGFEDVTIAGVTVNQQIGVANLTGWTSDYPYSGLLGLAYAGLTNAYPGESDENDSNANIMHYDPIFTSMYKQNVVPPIFSIALNRGNGANGGYLALGGLPPVSFIQEFASTPIQILNVDHITGATNNTARQFYLFEVDGLVYHNGSQTLADSAPWKKTENGTGFQTIIDSGE
jgi:hypothetical protein